MSIDWSKAPDWAIAHALQATSQGIQEVWVGEDKYQQLRFEKSFPYGGTVGADSYHNPRRYQFAFETLRPAPWTGEGLPPVGTVCDFMDDRDVKKSQWAPVEVKYLSAFTCVLLKLAPVDEFYEIVIHPVAAKFRPIRTPEQIAEDERSGFIIDLAGELSGHSRHIKQADMDMAKYLWSQGYRKVTP